MTNITFVDAHDNVIGFGTKKEAIDGGIAHRIARIMLFNLQGELLIQKRGSHLFSCPGKWDQSAAGHVDEGETYAEAACRETEEEVGVKNIELVELGKYYTEETDEAKPKKRFNTLYTAEYNGETFFSKEEVSEIRWVVLAELETWMKNKPDDFTEGFRKCYEYYRSKI
jgi:isopentenyldiphosphate isomerase